MKRIFLILILSFFPMATQAQSLLVTASGKTLKYNSGASPFLMMGDGTAQCIMGLLSPANMAVYFADRQAHGFNTLWVNLLCDTYTGGNANGTALDGTPPFTSGSGPANYDISTPNSAYFAEVDAMINLAATYGLVVVLDPAETGGWLATLVANGNSKCSGYGAYLGNRYKSFPNIIWMEGNDFQAWSAAGFPSGTSNSATASANNSAVASLMSGIAGADSNHLHTMELNYNLSGSLDDSSTAPYTTLAGAYTYYPTYYEVNAEGTSGVATLPVFLEETYYEGGAYGNLTPNTATNLMLRAAAYWTVLSGGLGGYIYGNNTYSSFGSGWQTGIDTTAVTQLGYWKSFILSLSNWQSLAYDSGHAICTSGYGTASGSPSGTPGVGNGNMSTDNYSTCSGTSNRVLALCYDPQGSALTIALSWFGAPLTARWYDPTNNTFSSISGSPFANVGSRSFSTPGNNLAGDPDWVLVLALPSSAAANSAMKGAFGPGGVR